MRKIDHIVYAVNNLEEGSNHIQSLLGCEVVQGGKHLNNGTHNALVNLGDSIYLEIIAVDLDNKNISAPRWMGIDRIVQPSVTRWAIKSNNLDLDLASLERYNPALASSFEGSRKKQDGSMLNWRMALPLPDPAIEIAPFLVDWKDSIHPTVSLPQECTLKAIEFYDPKPDGLQTLFSDLTINHQVMHSSESRIKLKIESPNGMIEL